MSYNGSKKGIGAVALVMVGVLGIGYVAASIATKSWNPAEWVKPAEQVTPGDEGDPVESGGTMLVTPTTNKFMTLSAVPMTITNEDGIEAQAENSYTLTATITPADATELGVDWTVEWKNSASTWASGKDVNDYVTLTPTSDGALTAALIGKQAFGEPIIAKATSRDKIDGERSGTAQIDYAQRITDGSLSMETRHYDTESETLTDYDKTYRASSTSQVINATYEKAGSDVDTSSITMSFSNPTGSAYTVSDIPGNGEFTYKLKIADTYKTAIQSALGVTVSEVVLNSFSYNGGAWTGLISKMFGTAYTNNRNKLYSTLQNYYTKNQAAFTINVSFTGKHTKTAYTFNYSLKLDVTTLRTAVTNVTIGPNSLIL